MDGSSKSDQLQPSPPTTPTRPNEDVAASTDSIKHGQDLQKCVINYAYEGQLARRQIKTTFGGEYNVVRFKI